MDNEYIEEATDEYLDVVKDKDKSFTRFNPILPLHIKLKMDRETEIVKQTRLTTSIYIRAAIMQYLDYVKELYNYADLNNLNSTLQLPLQLSDECYDDIDMISFITGNKSKATIVKNAIEYSFGQSVQII